MAASILAKFAGRLDLGERLRNYLLPRKARVDGHDRKDIDAFADRLNRRKRSHRAEHDSKLHAKLASALIEAEGIAFDGLRLV